MRYPSFLTKRIDDINCGISKCDLMSLSKEFDKIKHVLKQKKRRYSLLKADTGLRYRC